MGIGIEVHTFEKEILEHEGLSWNAIIMAELGNQKIKFLERKMPAKKFYKKLGIKEHVSIDLNNKNGAIIVDLDQPVPLSLVNHFNVITDYGTLEHVNHQFQAFKNIHDMCKIDGIMLHALPPPDHWPGHGRYYYPDDFFKQLAEKANYQIIDSIKRVARDGIANREMVLVALKKKSNDFLSREIFNAMPLVDSGDTATTGNYTQKKKKRFVFF